MKAINRAGGVKSRQEKRINKYLHDNHANVEGNPLELLIAYLKRLEGLKIGPYEAALKTRQLHSLYKLEELEPYLVDLNEVCSDRGVVILIDELDRGWDASEDAIAFVAGLFQAAVSIRAKTPYVRILISLRRELYDNIPALYEDAQKVRDVIEVIDWDEPRLLELVARRIAHSIRELGSISARERWNLCFAETMDYRQTKSFNYMVDRTLYRPRELIQFCLQTRSIALKNGDTPPLNYKTISEAEYAFSDERTKDIAAEYRFQYPGLGTVMETFRGMNYNFERTNLETHCLALAAGDFRVAHEATWCRDADPETIVEILWRVGFIRAQAIGGIKARRRSGSEYLGSHQVSSLNLRNIRKFHIHPMFRAALGLRESKSRTRNSDE